MTVWKRPSAFSKTTKTETERDRDRERDKEIDGEEDLLTVEHMIKMSDNDLQDWPLNTFEPDLCVLDNL